MNDTQPRISGSRKIWLVLQGIGPATSTDGASRFGELIAAVPPCEDERVDFGEATTHDEPWTEAHNDRRCDLIDRKYAIGLTISEGQELARLQELMVSHRRRVAPLPLEDARRLYRELAARVGNSQVATQS